jgi:glycerophosphoryl diester phosphodiesterase
MSPHAVLKGAPLLIAHRGGAGLAPENTLAAIVNGVEQWGADMVEIDVHASADGHCVVIHDDTVDRTTNGKGAVAQMTLAQLQSLDAGYNFTTDNGRTFPFRGKGVRIPTIAEVLQALPDMRFTIELKAAAAQRPLFQAIERLGARDRIVAAGMYDRHRTIFSEWRGAVSGSMEELQRYYIRYRLGFGRFTHPRTDVVQVPEMNGDKRLVTKRLISAFAHHKVPVHIWTVDDEADMHRLFDWGVEGIVTNRPDILAQVIHERTGRPLPPGHKAAPARP